MSAQAVKDFIERMKSDEAFRTEVLAAEVGEDRLAFVNEQGYDVTAQELVDASAPLSDEQLQHAVGGYTLDTCGNTLLL